MKLSHSEGRLAEITRDFNRIWQRSAEQWQDQRRDEFFREHIEPLLLATQEGTAALTQLSGVLKQVDQRCS